MENGGPGSDKSLRMFLSYPRTDSSHFPGRLKAKLSDEFGRSNVFFDVDNIIGGENFKVAISSSIAASM